ncbi:hypothetical protein AALO_G00302360 [Alosa alosa]|uniref:Dynein heavy chain C-terminal domain-containing protein n=1 Tax=Alosa alosa TaxID=278164 RepID=A0AAV6FF68_9TELE|nr:hypothetical protein AALO_G00302360 [Alosa alosa]
MPTELSPLAAASGSSLADLLVPRADREASTAVHQPAAGCGAPRGVRTAPQRRHCQPDRRDTHPLRHTAVPAAAGHQHCIHWGWASKRRTKVLELSADVLQKIPPLLDYEGTRQLLQEDPSPLNVVLLQEIQRYNALLHTIRTSLIELEKGIKGLVVMSSSLEETFNYIYDARVPPLWEKIGHPDTGHIMGSGVPAVYSEE